MHAPPPSTPPPPPLFWGTAGHLLAIPVPGVGHLQILRCPGAGHLPTPGPFPSFCHARGLLSKYHYTEDITGKKKADWLICQGHRVVNGMFSILCMHFFIAYQASLLILFEEHRFMFIKLFITLQRSINFNVNNFISILKP